MSRLKVSIVGGSGYAGGELLRLLLAHPHAEVAQVTSENNAGRFVHQIHPNLRKRTQLKFVEMNSLEACDVLFLCLPHKSSMASIDKFVQLANKIIDLGADFRLNSETEYSKWYGMPHQRPDLLAEFIYGIPEIYREKMRTSKRVSSAGCNATATILALYPLFKHGLIKEKGSVVEVKVGSSEGGNKPTSSSHHPERSNCVRSFKPVGHRHIAEILQELSFGKKLELHFSVTSVELVRGALATSHVFLKDDLSEKDIWKVYREEYGSEPFIRIVKDKQGIHRFPEPKILAGSNYCDISFVKDDHSNRLVVISAIDNLMKGAAGQALQAFNIMYGYDETTGLDFPGLHPV